jgi:hypothetical protein
MIASYSCYLIGSEREIVDRRDFLADSDANAIAIATTFSSEHTPPRGFEVWMGLRHVHKEASDDEKPLMGVLARARF